METDLGRFRVSMPYSRLGHARDYFIEIRKTGAKIGLLASLA